MKKILVFGVLLMFSSQIVSAQEWYTNFEKAKSDAKSKEINIVLVFQGSDWCAPCMKLDKEIWSTETFKSLAKDHFIMLKADFPRRKANQLSDELTQQNVKLAELYNAQGYFPFVVVLDSKGKVLGQIGYEKTTPETYFKKLTAFENF